ncbi:phage tail assembly protein, partial [Pseudomonas tolaasii]
LPYKIDKGEDVSLDLDVAARYIAVCAGIPPSSVNQLDLADFNALSWAVAGFFMSAAPAPSPN